MNLLLAIFYANFKIRFAQNFENENEERGTYLYKEFVKFDINGKEFLTEKESYKMFITIHLLACMSLFDIEQLELDDQDYVEKKDQLIPDSLINMSRSYE